MGLHVLFAVHDWGLGHATRDLLLIRALLRAGHEVTIISASRALALLEGELAGSCDFVELEDIPKPLSRRAAWFYVKMSLALPLVFRTFAREQQLVERLCRERRVDRVVSDTRYGVFSREVPSYYLVHSLRQIIPGRPRHLEALVERHQQRLLAGAVKILIPDQREGGLAGDLCHDVHGGWGDRLEYIGILSGLERRPVTPDVDYFISISGAEPQRSIFERLVIEQAARLRGRVVITLGKPDAAGRVHDNGHMAVHGFMDRRTQEEMMNRARLVVTRSGYTTMMELAELGRRALLIPTVGQSEQEYLADYHDRRGEMHAVRQNALDLPRDVARAERYPGLPAVRPTRESVARFLEIVTR